MVNDNCYHLAYSLKFSCARHYTNMEETDGFQLTSQMLSH